MAELETGHESTRPGQGRVFLSSLARRLPGPRAQLFFWSISVIAFVLDLLTKQAVFSRLDFGSSVSVIGDVVRLIKVHNDGAAFGLFAGHPNWLIGVSVIALIAVLCLFLFGAFKEKIMHIALAFFTAGIGGNLYDRIFNDGLVRDFIDVGLNYDLRWPAFNLADSLLCIGVGLMLIATYITERPCRKRAQQHK
jgi:signal peptidase II